MKITMEIESKDITRLCDGLNNAIIAYADIVGAIILRCDVPTKLEPLKNVDEKELKGRLDSLKGIYTQLLEIEKELGQQTKEGE